MAAVAVVIPALNPGPLLRVTLGSLLAQTFTEWEAIVVDDGSSEDLRWVGHLDSRVRIIRPRNAGASAARNTGILETDARLVAFLDADDRWLPTKLANQVQRLEEQPAVGLCSADFVIVDEAGRVTGPGYGGHDGTYRSLLGGNGIGTSTVMVRRDVLDEVGDFDVGLRIVQDWDLWLRIAATAPLTHVPQVLAHYRLHGAGISRDWRRTHDEALTVLAKHPASGAAGGPARVRELAAYQAFDEARAGKAGEASPA